MEMIENARDGVQIGRLHCMSDLQEADSDDTSLCHNAPGAKGQIRENEMKGEKARRQGHEKSRTRACANTHTHTHTHKHTHTHTRLLSCERIKIGIGVACSAKGARAFAIAAGTLLRHFSQLDKP